MSTVSEQFITIPVAFPVRRFSVEEYHRLGEADILTEDDAVELLDGLIVPKMNRTPQHDAVIGKIEKTLRKQLPAGWTVRGQSAFTTATSEPEPDIAVVRGEPDDYMQRHPAANDVALIVEVADSSVARDRAKARIYAAAGVAIYWIVNLTGDCIEVYTQPDASQPGYLQLAVYRGDEHVPLALPNAALRIPVRDCLP